jgi:hypothetical protein
VNAFDQPSVKYVAKRSKAILKQANEEWQKAFEELAKLELDLGQVRGLVDELKEEGAHELERLHREYLRARPRSRRNRERRLPDEDAHLRAVEQVVQATLLHSRKPELGLDGTNNAIERVIGKSKVRYKTMRGYKSTDGVKNGIALTQWPYDGEDEHDLAEEMAA